MSGVMHFQTPKFFIYALVNNEPRLVASAITEKMLEDEVARQQITYPDLKFVSYSRETKKWRTDWPTIKT